MDETKPISDIPKKTNKKGKKTSTDSNPVDTMDTSPQQTVDTSKASTDKKQKNDKNTKKQQQQFAEKATAAIASEETTVDDSKSNAKSKKQKTKKDKKSAKKQLDDNSKSNVSSLSEDFSNETEKHDLPKTKSKSKPEHMKTTKDKFNAKHEHIKDSHANEHTTKVLFTSSFSSCRFVFGAFCCNTLLEFSLFQSIFFSVGLKTLLRSVSYHFSFSSHSSSLFLFRCIIYLHFFCLFRLLMQFDFGHGSRFDCNSLVFFVERFV